MRVLRLNGILSITVLINIFSVSAQQKNAQYPWYQAYKNPSIKEKFAKAHQSFSKTWQEFKDYAWKNKNALIGGLIVAALAAGIIHYFDLENGKLNPEKQEKLLKDYNNHYQVSKAVFRARNINFNTEADEHFASKLGASFRMFGVGQGTVHSAFGEPGMGIPNLGYESEKQKYIAIIKIPGVVEALADLAQAQGHKITKWDIQYLFGVDAFKDKE